MPSPLSPQQVIRPVALIPQVSVSPAARSMKSPAGCPVPDTSESAVPPSVAAALTVATFGPSLVGLNAALNVQVADGARVEVHVLSESTNWSGSAPSNDTDTALDAVPPVLVTVKSFAAVVPPTGVLAKGGIQVGAIVRLAGPTSPVPLTAASTLLVRSSTRTVAVFEPALVGWNSTLKVQLAPDTSRKSQVFALRAN
jgi:hypothetical protein